MNVYDFDDTIYAGDSTVDFFFYCLKKKPAIVYVAGLQYKFLSLLCKLLPAAAHGKIVGKIYG